MKRKRSIVVTNDSSPKDVNELNALTENQVHEFVKMMELQDDTSKAEEVKEAQKAPRSNEDVQSDKSEIIQTARSTKELPRTRGADFFNVDSVPGRQRQYQLYRFNMRQKELSARAMRRSKKAEETAEAPKPKETPSDFYLPLLEDAEMLNLRKPWMLGVFDFDEKNVYAYEKFLEARLQASTWQNKIALESPVRFTLPMDLSVLRGRTPIDYLKQYCIVTETQEFLYTKCFGTMHAGTMIKPRDIISAATNRLTGVFTPEQIEEFTDLTDLESYESFGQAEVNGLIGLAERLYGVQNLRVTHPDLWLLLPSPLEKADFHNVRVRLRNLEVCEGLRRLLCRLEDVSRLDLASLSDDLLERFTDKEEAPSKTSVQLVSEDYGSHPIPS